MPILEDTKSRKFITRLLCLFLTLCLVLSCSNNSLTTTSAVKKLVNPSNSSTLKTPKRDSFSIKGQTTTDKIQVTKKSKNIPIDVEMDTKTEDVSKLPKPKHFSIKALTQTTFLPTEIGTLVNFNVVADPTQAWMIVIQGPNTTVCNAVVTMRTYSTGPVNFSLYIPPTFPLSGDYNVYIGDRDVATNTLLNASLIGNLKINNPRGLTLTKTSETSTQLLLGFSNQTGDIFSYQLSGPTSGTTSCLYYSNGTITIDKTVLLAGDYTAKISLMQYPDVTASYNFSIAYQFLPPAGMKTTGPDYLNTKLTANFDTIPPPTTEVIPGSVSVIYYNSAQIRIANNSFQTQAISDGNNGHGNDPNKCDPSNPGKSKPDCIRDTGSQPTLTAANSQDARELNRILKKYNIQTATDIALPTDTDADLDAAQIRVSQYFTTEVPNLRSVQVYKFPVDADTNRIAADLRGLSFVRTAYASPKLFFSGDFTEIARQDSHDDAHYRGTNIGGQLVKNTAINPVTNRPSDAKFTNTEKDWWWFNRHKVFQAWDYYSHYFGSNNIQDPNIPKPIIAVIDTGFDTDTTHDIPEYYKGAVFHADGKSDEVKDFSIDVVKENLSDDPDFKISLDPKNPSNKTLVSHGAFVSSIIASPVNNGKGLCGVIPGAKIMPIKIIKLPEIVDKAIRYAATNGADAINLSLGPKDTPISWDPEIGAAIAYAVTDNGVPVAISAGNNLGDLDANLPGNCSNPATYPTCVDYGQVTVGGTNTRGEAWVTLTSIGSNYGKAIDMAAGAEKIMATTFSPENNSEQCIALNGTSFAAPMVASTLGMMKKISSMKAINLDHLITYTSTLSLGKILALQPEHLYMGRMLSYDNIDGIARIRDLNMYNALALISSLKPDKPYIVRIFNTDGETQATLNEYWINPYANEGKEIDSFKQYQGSKLPDDTVFSFITRTNGELPTFGYQIYNLADYTLTERILGVTARYGVSQDSDFILFNTDSSSKSIKILNDIIVDPITDEALYNIPIK